MRFCDTHGQGLMGKGDTPSSPYSLISVMCAFGTPFVVVTVTRTPESNPRRAAAFQSRAAASSLLDLVVHVGLSYRSLVQGKFPDVNQNSDSEGSQTGDRLESTEFREIAEICKTGIRQLLGSPYDSGRNSC